jgi:hypothetical protein
MVRQLSISERRLRNIGPAIGDNSTPRKWFLDGTSDDTSDADSNLEFDDVSDELPSIIQENAY